MKVIICEANHRARVEEIENTLEAMQAVVGGYIETVDTIFNGDAIIVCNENGKIDNLEANRLLVDRDGNICDVIHGTFFVCGVGEEDFDDVPEELVDMLCHYFNRTSVYWALKKSGAILESV